MKIQIDFSQKTIKIEDNLINLGDLIKHLDKLFPKDGHFGSWKDYKLETNTTILSWTNPIHIYDSRPYEPFWQINPMPSYQITNGFISDCLERGYSAPQTSMCYNLELHN